MSYKVAARVWEHSRQRGSLKLLLLAFAEFANDDGICWPAAWRLARYINETERNVRLLIKKLVADGELITVPGGGRGNTTRYGVAIGLNTRQLQKLNSDLHNTVSHNTEKAKNSDLQNTDHEKTVKSGDENSEISCQETVKSGSRGNSPNDAAASHKNGIFHNDNRHVEPSLDPSDHDSRRRASRAPPSPHQQLMHT